MNPSEFRNYSNEQGELVNVAILERKPIEEWSTHPEGRLYVEITIEALEQILTRAGFIRTSDGPTP